MPCLQEWRNQSSLLSDFAKSVSSTKSKSFSRWERKTSRSSEELMVTVQTVGREAEVEPEKSIATKNSAHRFFIGGTIAKQTCFIKESGANPVSAGNGPPRWISELWWRFPKGLGVCFCHENYCTEKVFLLGKGKNQAGVVKLLPSDLPTLFIPRSSVEKNPVIPQG